MVTSADLRLTGNEYANFLNQSKTAFLAGAITPQLVTSLNSESDSDPMFVSGTVNADGIARFDDVFRRENAAIGNVTDYNGNAVTPWLNNVSWGV